MAARAELTNVSLELQYKDSSGALQTLGDYKQDLHDTPIVVEGHSSFTTPPLCVTLRKILSPLLIKAFLQAASSSSGAPVWLKGPATVRLGGKVEVDLVLVQ
eukprot:CAMPEP_0179408730 /NCGR_PEP_ID=MMETSP0799-20121207/2271_1 /TAXON_ID=46947 /ORGANISM="Geminigera cryophila, Strain CCMP2564" /LENGTH=101 /DNA_ID=CAMNT_0021180255 /DNA_START=282 /DNA_END=584 /DNA_ORIENTATION=-